MCSWHESSTVWLSLVSIQVFVTWAQNDNDTNAGLTVGKEQGMLTLDLKKNEMECGIKAERTVWMQSGEKATSFTDI